MKRYQEFEEAVQKLLDVKKLKYMRVSNYRCYKCGTVQNASAKNWPDFFIYAPILLAIECKTGAAGLTKGQQILLGNMKQTGVDVLVLHDNVDDLITYLKEKKL